MHNRESFLPRKFCHIYTVCNIVHTIPNIAIFSNETRFSFVYIVLNPIKMLDKLIVLLEYINHFYLYSK